MTVKAYKKRCEKIRRKRLKRGRKRFGRFSKIRIKNNYSLKNIKKNSLSIRINKRIKKRKNIKIKKKSHKVNKVRRYFSRCLRRKYRRRKYKYRIRRKSSKKIQKHVEKLFNYPDRKIQPKWVLKKISFILSYFNLYKHLYQKSDIKNKVYVLLNIKKKARQKHLRKTKTFIYNNNSCKFITKTTDLIPAKIYRNLRFNLQNYSICKLVRNIIWKILCKFKYRRKKHKKKSRRLYFKLRMLRKSSNFKKYRYRRKKIYKAKKKKALKKKVKIRLNRRKVKKVIFNISKKNTKKTIKTKHLLKALQEANSRSYRRFKKVQFFLHYIKRRTLGVNDIIKRKKKRRSYWLTKLRFHKKDIKNAFCLKIIYHHPLLLRKLLTIR